MHFSKQQQQEKKKENMSANNSSQKSGSKDVVVADKNKLLFDLIKSMDTATKFYNQEKDIYDLSARVDGLNIKGVYTGAPKIDPSKANPNMTKMKILVLPACREEGEKLIPIDSLQANVKELLPLNDETKHLIKEPPVPPNGKYSLLFETYPLKPGSVITVSIQSKNIVWKKVAIGEVVELYDVTVTRSKNDKGIIYFWNANSAKKIKGISVYQLDKAISKGVSNSRLKKQTDKTFLTGEHENLLILRVSEESLTDISMLEKDGSVVKPIPFSEYVQANWYFTPNQAGTDPQQAKIQKPCYKAKYSVGQWEKGGSNQQLIKIDVNAFGDALKSFGVYSEQAWKDIMFHNIKFIDHTIIGNIDVNRTSSMIYNSEDVTDNSKFSFVLAIQANMILFDMNRFIKLYGIPVSEKFVLEYFESDSAKYADLFEQDNPYFVCLNSLNTDISSFASKNKGKCQYRVITDNPAMTTRWKDEIKDMSTETGDNVVSGVQGANNIISIQEINKKFIFAIFPDEIKKIDDCRPKDLFTIIKEQSNNNNNNNGNQVKAIEAPKGKPEESKKDDRVVQLPDGEYDVVDVQSDSQESKQPKKRASEPQKQQDAPKKPKQTTTQTKK